jgi:transcriptional regulator with XRE-family HTH domain
MPRSKSGPLTPWPALASCTRFGALLVEWMWRQRPPTPVAVLAARIGVDRSTLVSWLTTERQPQPLQLLLLAQVTELPLEDLAAAASVQLERVHKQRAVLFDYVAWETGRSGAVSNDERAHVLARLLAVRNTPPTFPNSEDARDAANEDTTNEDTTDQDLAGEESADEAKGVHRQR